MTTYYLQTKIKKEFVVGALDDRKVISENLGSGYEQLATVEANSWLEAKEKLGYELTKLQKQLL
jgi:hypothetical protein